MKYKEGVSVEDIAAYIGDLPNTVRKHYISVQDTIDAGDNGIINYIHSL